MKKRRKNFYFTQGKVFREKHPALFVLLVLAFVMCTCKAYELSADYIGAWWNHDATHHYFSNYALQTEVRYSPGQKKEMHGYNVGRHIGIYGQMATYDFEFGGTGYM